MTNIRLLAILEATTITGPAKNLLQFARCARSGETDIAVEVSIAVFQRGAGSNLFIDTARRESIPVYPIHERARFDRAVISRLSALTRELHPDLIQSHAVKSHFLVRRAALDRMAPWVAFHHGYTWPDLRARLYNQLDRWSLRTARRVLTVSLAFRNELVRRGVEEGRIEVIQNAIDSHWGAAKRSAGNAAALRASLGIGPGEKVILIVGRVSREKDHRTLLLALARLRAAAAGGATPLPRLVIAGDGPERPRIEEIIRQLGLADAVNLAGQVPTAEPYYGIADVCVLSSLSEGSPNALLEAMAARVPVVATRSGGIPEIVAHGESALLIQPRDVEGMTRAIAAVLTDETLARRLTGRAYELILTRHTPASRARRLAEVYCRVLR
jgi:glycosyltransferase involved in cell wall biosynthesis